MSAGGKTFSVWGDDQADELQFHFHQMQLMFRDYQNRSPYFVPAALARSLRLMEEEQEHLSADQCNWLKMHHSLLERCARQRFTIHCSGASKNKIEPSKPHLEPKSESQPESRPEPKSQPKQESKSESQPQSKPKSKAKAKHKPVPPFPEKVSTAIAQSQTIKELKKLRKKQSKHFANQGWDVDGLYQRIERRRDELIRLELQEFEARRPRSTPEPESSEEDLWQKWVDIIQQTSRDQLKQVKGRAYQELPLKDRGRLNKLINEREQVLSQAMNERRFGHLAGVNLVKYRQRLSALLSQWQIQQVLIEGDGNCVASALGRQLSQPGSAVRQDLHRLYQVLKETDPDLPEVVALAELGEGLLLEEKEWLDVQPVLALAAKVYKRPVVHIMPSTTEPRPVAEIYWPDDSHDPETPIKQTLVMLHDGYGHYNAGLASNVSEPVINLLEPEWSGLKTLSQSTLPEQGDDGETYDQRVQGFLDAHQLMFIGAGDSSHSFYEAMAHGLGQPGWRWKAQTLAEAFAQAALWMEDVQPKEADGSRQVQEIDGDSSSHRMTMAANMFQRPFIHVFKYPDSHKPVVQTFWPNSDPLLSEDPFARAVVMISDGAGRYRAAKQRVEPIAETSPLASTPEDQKSSQDDDITSDDPAVLAVFPGTSGKLSQGSSDPGYGSEGTLSQNESHADSEEPLYGSDLSQQSLAAEQGASPLLIDGQSLNELYTQLLKYQEDDTVDDWTAALASLDLLSLDAPDVNLHANVFDVLSRLLGLQEGRQDHSYLPAETLKGRVLNELSGFLESEQMLSVLDFQLFGDEEHGGLNYHDLQARLKDHDDALTQTPALFMLLSQMLGQKLVVLYRPPFSTLTHHELGLVFYPGRQPLTLSAKDFNKQIERKEPESVPLYLAWMNGRWHGLADAQVAVGFYHQTVQAVCAANVVTEDSLVDSCLETETDKYLYHFEEESVDRRKRESIRLAMRQHEVVGYVVRGEWSAVIDALEGSSWRKAPIQYRTMFGYFLAKAYAANGDRESFLDLYYWLEPLIHSSRGRLLLLDLLHQAPSANVGKGTVIKEARRFPRQGSRAYIVALASFYEKQLHLIDAARAVLKRYHQDHPDDWRIVLNMAGLAGKIPASKRQERDCALRDLEQSLKELIRKYPNNPEIVACYAVLCGQLGQAHRAYSALEKVGLESNEKVLSTWAALKLKKVKSAEVVENVYQKLKPVARNSPALYRQYLSTFQHSSDQQRLVEILPELKAETARARNTRHYVFMLNILLRVYVALGYEFQQQEVLQTLKSVSRHSQASLDAVVIEHLLFLGQTRKARLLADKLVNAGGSERFLVMLQARAHADDQSPDADRLMNNLFSQFEKKPEAHYQIGREVQRYYQKTRQMDQWVKVSKRLQKAFPGDKKLLHQLAYAGKEAADSFVEEAGDLFDGGHSAEARDRYLKAASYYRSTFYNEKLSPCGLTAGYEALSLYAWLNRTKNFDGLIDLYETSRQSSRQWQHYIKDPDHAVVSEQQESDLQRMKKWRRSNSGRPFRELKAS
ncbi:OTU domain-containing protein [Parendozoicomonas haliclonae]|nr:OTU domain-containing protein [Parendozoicomonas haliclonae]